MGPTEDARTGLFGSRPWCGPASGPSALTPLREWVGARVQAPGTSSHTSSDKVGLPGSCGRPWGRSRGLAALRSSAWQLVHPLGGASLLESWAVSGHSQLQALQVTARPGGLPLAASLPLSLAPPPSHGLTLGTSRVVLVPLGLQKRGPQGDSQAERPSAALHSHLPGQGPETWAWGPPGHPSLRLCLPFGLQEPCLCHYCDHTLRCQLPGHSVYARVSIIRLYKYGDAHE